MAGITFKALYDKLKGWQNGISASVARDVINEALRDIYDSGDWGILYKDGFIRTPALIEGIASVQKFNELIALDASTKAKIDSISINEIPIEQRQIRFLGTREVESAFSYNILDYDSITGVLTIDPTYQDMDNTSIQVQILKLYYSPPSYVPYYDPAVDPVPDPIVDFRRFEYVFSPLLQRRINLGTSINQVNVYDPARITVAEPRHLILYGEDALGVPLYEFYPAPRFERVFRVKYLRQGLPLVREKDRVPDIFSQDLILSRAKIKSCEWMLMNAETLKLKSVGRFQNLIAFEKVTFDNLLEKAKKNDEEKYPKAYIGDFADKPYADPFFPFGDNMECHGETLILNF